MRLRFVATSLVVAVSTSLAVGVPAASANITGNEGCTPGYWKNHTQNWEEYAPSDTLDLPFDFPDSLAQYRTVTLDDALALRGGKGVDGAAQILLRAATAAVLNAAHEGVGYPYRRFKAPFNIVSKVNAALASGDRQRMLELAQTLDAANNLGCPLN